MSQKCQQRHRDFRGSAKWISRFPPVPSGSHAAEPLDGIVVDFCSWLRRCCCCCIPRREGASLSGAAGCDIISGFAARGGRTSRHASLGTVIGAARREFIIENRPGAGTRIAAEAVVRSAPDGTPLWCLFGERDQRDVIHEAEFQLDPRHRSGRGNHHDAEPDDRASIGSGRNCCRVHSACRGQSGRVNMASAGNGSISHLAG